LGAVHRKDPTGLREPGIGGEGLNDVSAGHASQVGTDAPRDEG
jgi:hypothetical protein